MSQESDIEAVGRQLPPVPSSGTETFHESPEASNNGDSEKDKISADHVVMMALSGSLGIGMLIGIGSALASGGPASLIIGFLLVGSMIFHLMCAVGEVCAYIPMSQGFAGYATRYVDPCLGFAVGWTYYVNYLVVTPHQLTAGAMLLQYWADRDKVNPGIFIAIFWLFAVVMNYYGGLKFISRFQYWSSAIKIATMATISLILLVICLGGNPNGEFVGGKYWRDPGAFKEYDEDGVHIGGHLGRLLAVFTVGTSAVFSFLGVELVGVTVGEARNPRVEIPSAVRLISYRSVGFYIITTLLVGLCVPWNDPQLHALHGVGTSPSPFLIAMTRYGLSWMAHFFNALFILFIFAAAVAAMYIGTRTLQGLAEQNKAPKCLARVNERGVATNALFVTSVLSLTSLLNISSSSSVIFDHFVSFSALLGLLTWTTVFITHIQFMKALRAQGVDRKALPYKAPGQPFNSWYHLVVCVLMALAKCFPAFLVPEGGKIDWVTLIIGYIAIPMFIALCLGYKLATKCTRVRPEDADLLTGKKDVDDLAAEYREHDAEKRHKKNITPWYKKYLKAAKKILF